MTDTASAVARRVSSLRRYARSPKVLFVSVDKPPIRPNFDVWNAPEHQQVVRIGSGVPTIVTVSEVTPHIPAMQIE